MHFEQVGDVMKKKTREIFSVDFKLESAQLVVDKNHSARATPQRVRGRYRIKQTVLDYIISYYSQVRPHRHNHGLASNDKEYRYWE